MIEHETKREKKNREYFHLSGETRKNTTKFEFFLQRLCKVHFDLRSHEAKYLIYLNK